MRARRTALLRITHGSPLYREGKNSHRHGFAATPPSKREASYNHSRKQGFPAPAPHICAYLRLRGKSEGGDAILLRKQRRREKPNAEPTANVGFLFPSRDYHTAALAKKISKKDFLRRGAASVLSVVFGCAEPPAVRAPPRRCQFKKKFANPLSYSYTTAGTDCRNRA